MLRRLYERDRATADQKAPGRWTPFLEATTHNHLDTVRFLLTCHVVTNADTEEGLSAEGYASSNSYDDIVAALREAPGEPPEPAPAPEVPLVAAATAGDVVTLVKLLDQGGAIETRNSNGLTLLMCAVKYKKPEAVRVLLARHADPNNLSLFGNSPLDFAVESQNEENMKMLIEAGSDPNGFRVHDEMGDNLSPVFALFKNGRVDLITYFMAHGARLNDTSNVGDTALIQAARWPHVEVLAFLLEQGQSVNTPNHYGYTALMYAATNGCEDNIRFLLGKGADLHAKAKDRNPDRHIGQPFGVLEAALYSGQPYAQEILMDAGATPANPGAKLTEELFSGIDGKNFERVQAALHKGASPNEPDPINRLPLIVAVLIGDPGVVQLLLKAGADVNATAADTPGSTPLSHALERQGAVTDPHAKQNYTRIVDLLHQAHATR